MIIHLDNFSGFFLVASKRNFLEPWFIGSYGEHGDLIEELMLELLREHALWRRDANRENSPSIKNSNSTKPEFTEAVKKIKKQLHQLTSNLKKSLPVNSPQYFGALSSDLLLPALIAQLATTLYNPANIPTDIVPDTFDMELEVGQQIARMLGYNTDPKMHPCAWGHITSSATTANYESLWNARAVSFYPLAMKAAAIKLHLDIKISASSHTLLSQCSSWRCQNFSVDDVVALQKFCYQQLFDKHGQQTAENFFQQVNQHRVEHMGMAAFFAEHWDAKLPLVLIPSTAHSSWEKAMRLLGFGTSQLITLEVNNRMRVDVDSLERVLVGAEQKKIPILSVVGILGDDDFGSIDPLAEIVQLREHFKTRGLNFYFHIDAARGGYLCSLFRNEDDSLVSYEEIQSQFKSFPSQTIYEAFAAVNKADSVTVAPHKTGYLPFGTGAFISRNREITNFLAQNGPHISKNGTIAIEQQIKQLDDYIIEGSKSGVAAAACHLTHKVLPLNKNHFGRILGESIHNSEYFFKRIKQTIKNLENQVNMVIPMKPDSNLFCLAINPINNHCLARMNRFSQRVYERLQVTTDESVREKAFYCSSTSLLHCSFGNEDAQHLLKKLGIKKSSYVVNIQDPKVQTNSIHVLSHTLLNPWLLTRIDGKNTIDRYCIYLEQVIVEVVNKESSNILIAVGAS